MFFHVQWKSPKPLQRRSIRIPAAYGHVDLWAGTSAETTELALLFEAENCAYGTPALILSVAEKLRNLAGLSQKIVLAPVPRAWSGPKLLRTFEAAGFLAQLNGRTLELKGEMDIWAAINRVSVLSCLLDRNAAAYPELLGKARRAAIGLGLGEALCFQRGGVPPQEEAAGSTDHAITTRRGESILIKNWESTVDAFSSGGVEPRWLCYLPPGVATLQSEKLNEPLEAAGAVFEYYRAEEIEKVVVERHNAGSRAVVVVCKDAEAAMQRFGTPELGAICSKMGRVLFQDSARMLNDLREALCRADFWGRFQTGWVCLEGEYSPAVSTSKMLEHCEKTLAVSEARYEAALSVLKRFEAENRIEPGRAALRKFRLLCEEHRRASNAPLSFAPFHLVAIEGKHLFGMTRLWHRETLNALARKAGAPFSETPYQLVSLKRAADVERCIAWSRDFPGVVIKPLPFLPRGRRGGAQPSFLCRSQEQLRFVYGPEYDLPENRLSLNQRAALANRKNKRRKILKQWQLAIEGVERFISREPIERVQECTRGVLALA